MPILLPVGVANALNTPAAYTGLIADIPDYNDVQIGTIYIGTDNASIQTATAGGWVALGTGGGGGSQNLDQTLTNGNTTTQSAIFSDSGFQNTIAGQYLTLANGSQQLENLISAQGFLLQDITANAETLCLAYQFQITQDEFITNITPAIANFNDTSLFLVSEISPGWVFVQSNVTNSYGNLKIVGGQALLILGDPVSNRQITVGSDFITFKDLASDKTQTIYPNTYNFQDVNIPADSGVIALQNPPKTNVDLSTGQYTLNGQKQQTYIIQDVGNDILLDANQWEDNYTVTLLVKSSGFGFQVLGSSSFHGNPTINLEGIYFITYITADDAFFCSNI
jgi:hypothetical protein